MLAQSFPIPAPKELWMVLEMVTTSWVGLAPTDTTTPDVPLLG